MQGLGQGVANHMKDTRCVPKQFALFGSFFGSKIQLE